MPEAICGIAISMASICDWRGRGGLAGEWAVDDDETLITPAPPGAPVHDGWLPRMLRACEEQLFTVYSDNVGIVRSVKGLDGWLDLIRIAKGRPLNDKEYQYWKTHFSPFFS